MKNQIGQIYGQLTVISFAGHKSFGKQGRQNILWTCLCSCGTEKIISATKLPTTKSCGCLKNCSGIHAPNYQHGYSRRAEYTAYNAAHERCSNPKNPSYNDYGGRGIQFLYSSFDQFITDVGDKPNKHYSLDRKNSNGHYEPGNCQWSDGSTQAKNKRPRFAIENFSDEQMQKECLRRGWTITKQSLPA
jgi:hypothetical protein